MIYEDLFYLFISDPSLSAFRCSFDPDLLNLSLFLRKLWRNLFTFHLEFMSENYWRRTHFRDALFSVRECNVKESSWFCSFRIRLPLKGVFIVMVFFLGFMSFSCFPFEFWPFTISFLVKHFI